MRVKVWCGEHETPLNRQYDKSIYTRSTGELGTYEIHVDSDAFWCPGGADCYVKWNAIVVGAGEIPID